MNLLHPSCRNSFGNLLSGATEANVTLRRSWMKRRELRAFNISVIALVPFVFLNFFWIFFSLVELLQLLKRTRTGTYSFWATN